MLFKHKASTESGAKKPRRTQAKLIAVAAAVLGLSVATAGGIAHAATSKAKGCKDLVLVAYIESQGDRLASIPFKVRPCGNASPKSWTESVGGASTTATGDNIGWVLQGLDIRLEGLGANSKTAASAHYKGVAKLTQKTPNMPLVPVAPISIRSMSVAIKFTVFHQKNKSGKSTNVKLKDFIRVDGTWSSHPEWVNFKYKKTGIVNGK
ncbi:hypothetical protein ACWDV4_04920 [Micromonospora sp. NPDC003197]